VIVGVYCDDSALVCLRTSECLHISGYVRLMLFKRWYAHHCWYTGASLMEREEI